jgi:aryl-alcohol dehydrogenase-like predicted oxidoreductase
MSIMTAARLVPRPLGRTGLRVTPLGLASMSMRKRGPGLLPGDVERAFHEHGINVFLVHYLAKHLCEGVRRLIRAGHREALVLISGASLPFAGSVRRSLERHLRVLETDRLDGYFMGWVRNRWWVRKRVWAEMVRLRESGKVRALGFSTHDRKLAAALAVELPADLVMIRYNAAHRGAEREIFAPLASLGAKRPGIIGYTSTRWGMLLDPLPKRGFATGMTAGECYRFALGNPMVDMAWCAAQSAEQIAEDVQAVLEGPLPAGQRAD